MFGATLPPGIDTVRILALNGKKGKPPCLWEGLPNMEQATIEAQIAKDRRVVRWLHKNDLIQNGSASLSMQLDLFSQGKKVDSITVQNVSFLVDKIKKNKSAGDAIALRAFDLSESMHGMFQQLLAERDTVIGRLVERGFKYQDRPPIVEAPPAQKADVMSEFLEKGSQFLQLAKMFRELKEDR